MFLPGFPIIPYVPKVVGFDASTVFPRFPSHSEECSFQHVHAASTPPLASRRSPAVMLWPWRLPRSCTFTSALQQLRPYTNKTSTRCKQPCGSFLQASASLDTVSTGSLATNQLPCVQVTFVFCRRLCSNASIQRPRRYVPTHLACCHTPKSVALHKMANILAVCMSVPPYGFRPLVFCTCQLRYPVHLPKCQPKLELRAF